MSAYFAVGLWHHWLVRRDIAFVRRFWPSVRAGARLGGLPADAVRRHQLDAHRVVLAAGRARSSIYQSLRAGVALADLLDDPQPEWELAGGRLGHAVREHRDLFADKSTYSMDWYYPVLGGAVRGREAFELLESRWDEFVVPGLGIRCVDTNPWVTGAETCELAMALDILGDHRRALRLLADMQHLRGEDGKYWTGWVYATRSEKPDVNWPVEHTTYTAAAVILAVDALGEIPGHSIARVGDHARHLAGAALPRDRARVRLPLSRRASPASPAVRRSTRIEPSASTSSKAPLSSARRKTWYGGCPPSAGSGEHVVDHEQAAGHHPRAPSPRSRSGRAPRRARRR